MLDLYCGRWGWSKAFAERGWECVGVDLVEPPEVPKGCSFLAMDIEMLSAKDGCVCDRDGHNWKRLGKFDFIVASSPCEEFSCFTMKMWQPNPKYPEAGIRLFTHTRAMCEGSGLPYVMENVRGAQEFVGRAAGHCGPFYLWGSAVPPILPQGITKTKWKANALHGRQGKPGNFAPELRWSKAKRKAALATIPPELANCVADFAERLIEQDAYSRNAENLSSQI